MQLFNVCAKKVYDKDGEKKIKWYKVGLLKITDAGKKYLQLFHLPQTEYFLFENTEPTPDMRLENKVLSE